jgi:hypothetical protein
MVDYQSIVGKYKETREPFVTLNEFRHDLAW